MAANTDTLSSVPDLRSIVEQLKRGSRRDYDIYLNKLINPETSSQELLSHIIAAKECITMLDKEHENLVGVLLQVHWTTREKYVVEGYQSFLLNLVSAHTYYLRAGLRMLIKHFIIKKETKEEGETAADVVDLQKYETCFRNVHLVLKAITKIVPMTPTVLMPLLSDFFPYLSKESTQQEGYVRNLLQITHYLPSIRWKVLELIVNKMIKLDVRSPKHEIKETEGEEEEMEDGDVIFDMDELDPNKEKEVGSCNPGVSCDTSMSFKPMSHKEADKLDIMMYVTLEYIQNFCHKNGKLDWEATKLLYRELLLVFEKVILPTHGSCHVQFIMFYICSFKQELCEGFIDFLWKKVQNPNTESVFRQSSSAYIGSLLSRGLYVPINTVKVCLELMCGWVHKYMDQTEEDSLHADCAHHGAFYAVCQTIFYVFAFRHKEIFELRKGNKWAQSLNFQRIVTSRLNPLRICLPVIVKTFASITRMHQLAFCDTVMERNNRCFIPAAGESTADRTLESFFPFDPYLLHRSVNFIKPHFRDFQGNIIEDEEKITEDEEDDFITDDNVPTGNIQFLSKTPTDLMNYCISPGFKTEVGHQSKTEYQREDALY